MKWKMKKWRMENRKRHRLFVLALTLPIVLILLPVVYFGLQFAPKSEAAWMNDLWTYRIKVPVTAHTSLETNVYFSVTVDTSDTTRFQTDCGDMRFTDSNGKQLQYYIVSGCSSATTVTHVLVPSLPAGASDYYLYYGNANALNGFSSADFTTAASNITVGTVGSEEKGTGPIGYWAMDEGLGTTTHDISSSNQTATFGASTAAPTWAKENQCISGKCIDFDGTDDYMSIGSTTRYRTASKTVSFWAKPDVDPSGTTPIFSSGGANWYVGFSSSGRMMTSHSVTAGTQQTTYSTNSSIVVKNTWSFYSYVFSVSGSNVDISFYINGKLDGTTSYTTGYSSSYSDTWVLGAFNSSSLFFNGKLDEVKIYNYARSATQIKADYASRGTGDSSATTAGGITQSILSDKLVGYWKMDESTWGTPDCSTAVVLDSSGAGNDYKACPASTGPTGAGAGKFGYAGVFDGSNDYIDGGDDSDLEFNTTSAQLTFAAWVNPTTVAPAASMTILSKYFSTGNQREYGFQIGTTGKIQLSLSSDGSAVTTFSSTSSLTASTWQHVAVTYDLATTKTRFYINGVLDREGTIAVSSIFAGTSSFHIGAVAKSTTTPDLFFSGSLDEVRIYKKALSANEVRNLFKTGPGPIGYWKFDEKSGSSTFDSSGSGFTGTLTNSPSWVAGKFGSGLQMTSGSSQDVNLGATNTIFPNANNWTVSLWVKRNTASSTVSSDEYLLSLRGTAGRTVGLNYRSATNTLNFEYRDNVATFHRTSLATLATIADSWQHFEGAYDGTTFYMYLNGVLISTSTDTFSGFNSSTIRVGSDSGSSPASATFDNVIFYNYARNAQQVIEDMNGGHPAGGSPIGSQVAFWRMDEANGTTAHDTNSTSSNDLTLSASSWTAVGKVNAAWNGTGAVWLTRSDDADFDFTASESFSVSMWVKSDSATNPSSIEYLFNKASATIAGYAVYFNTSGQVCFGIDDDTTWGPDIASCSAADVYDATWHHVVAVRDTTADTTNIYVDGTRRDSDTDPTTATLANSLALYVGDRDGTDNGDEFNGDLDEVKVYRSALTSDQVLIDANSGSALNFGVAAPTSEPAQMTDGAGNPPAAYWTFNEKKDDTCSGGTNDLCDVSGNGNDGASSNGPVWRTGKYGSSLNFDGADDVVTVANSSTVQNIFDTAGTIEAWVYPETDGEGTAGRIVDKGNMVVWLNSLSAGNLKISLQQNFDGGTNGSWTSTNRDIPANAWTHIAVTYNNGSTTNDPTIYVNGRSVAITENTTPTGTRVSDAASSLYIGNNSAGSRTFDGSLDDVRMYDYARTAAQVAYDYNRGTPVGFWRFDECQGTVANDSSGNGNNGTITIGASGTTPVGTCVTSSTAWGNGASGKFNAALSYDGTDDYTDLGDLSYTEGASQLTWSFWVKPTALATLKMFLGKLNIGSNPGVNSTEVSWGSGTLSADSNDTDCAVATTTTDVSTVGYTTSDVLANGTWAHIVCVFDGTASGNANRLKMYVNGRQVTLTYLGTIPASTQATTSNVRIGASADNLSFFNGLIDDVRIYNYALSAAQVRKVYEGGSNVFFGPATGSP